MISTEVPVIQACKLIDNSSTFSGSLDVTDFRDSSLFLRFANTFLLELNSLLLHYSVGANTIKTILDRYKAPPCLIQLHSSGLKVDYIFPNKEVKSLILFQDSLIVDDDYWLQFYPFLCLIKKDENQLFARLNEDFINTSAWIDSGDSPVYILSHNKHFGHFLFDDLPRIYIDNLRQTYFHNRYKAPDDLGYGIQDLLNIIIPNINFFSKHLQSQSIIEASRSTYQSIITNPIVNIFIVQRIIGQLSRTICKSSSAPSKVFLRRTGPYESRIHNLGEIRSILQRNGYFEVDPAELSSCKLLAYLSKASSIFAESGTSTLVAALFAPVDCLIISFLPTDLLLNPTPSMVRSGLPYHFIRPDKQRFILGIPTKSHPIQSSSTCYYPPDELNPYL